MVTIAGGVLPEPISSFSEKKFEDEVAAAVVVLIRVMRCPEERVGGRARALALALAFALFRSRSCSHRKEPIANFKIVNNTMSVRA